MVTLRLEARLVPLALPDSPPGGRRDGDARSELPCTEPVGRAPRSTRDLSVRPARISLLAGYERRSHDDCQRSSLRPARTPPMHCGQPSHRVVALEHGSLTTSMVTFCHFLWSGYTYKHGVVFPGR
jgi:hypothetical protein